MLKLMPALLLSLLFAPSAFAYDALAIYRAFKAPLKEHCHNTSECPGQYVQIKEAGGLRCYYVIRSEPLSPVRLECNLSRYDHQAVYEALRVESRDGQKSVGGLVCEYERSFWGGGRARCALR